ncbi:MAG: diguanylate cyclase [Clostridiales Family XIII bacterium]|jgi:EAL and modified HD-GYP domain-containing signal transduction protein|nr:diguanylate cyclase [Clostridiales Family XIII bacterium]
MILSGNKRQQLEDILGGILDSFDMDVVVVGKKDKKVLFLNEAANDRLSETSDLKRDFKNGYASIFPGLFELCFEDENYAFSFEIEDVNGSGYAGVSRPALWVDDKECIVLSIRNIDEEKENSLKLFNLAYIDQLTGVPNRQKLREDFERIRERIVSGELCGVIALFDLDNFKSINDTYGHNTGDVMLRRITSLLQENPVFSGHLYRLGGDEFVLLYSGSGDEFRTDTEMYDHFSKMLSGALMSYTMPNIELSCTISMGVSFFPRHGHNFPELLRKADIALYKAKAGGRARLVLFEEQYDSAKKFKDLYINIQPILDNHGVTFGYELIDRGNEGKDMEDEVNLTEFDRTMDVVDLSVMAGKTCYFISYSAQLLNAAVRNGLPKDKFVVQIQARSQIDAVELRRYKELKSYGYTIAAAVTDSSDLAAGQSGLAGLIEIADYIKIDLKIADEGGIAAVIAANRGKRFIALNVDSADDFELASIRGFELFQGFFFSQPQVTKKVKDIHPLQLNYIKLLRLTSEDGYVDFKEISDLIATDVAMSYKLLRLLNSAAVGLRNRVSSIQAAVAILGENNLKKWIATLALRGVAASAPLELVRISLVRARFGELLAPHFKPRRNPKHAFTTGLLSLLHVALEKSRDELFEEIPVADDIKDSLVSGKGPFSDMIAFFNNYEYANWDEIAAFASLHGLSDKLISDSYIEAVKWYNELAGAGDEAAAYAQSERSI